MHNNNTIEHNYKIIMKTTYTMMFTVQFDVTWIYAQVEYFQTNFTE